MTLDSLNLQTISTLRASLLEINLTLEQVSHLPTKISHLFRAKLGTLWSSESQIDRLKKQLENQKERHINVRLLERENQHLKNLLTLIPQNKTPYITAKIYPRSKSFSEDSFFISTPASTSTSEYPSIKPLSPVVLGNLLIGYIKEIGVKSALVCPITATQSRVPVISEKTGIKAIVAGLNHGKLMIRHVEGATDTFEEGELLLSTSEGSLYPDGYVVGRITYKTSSINENTLQGRDPKKVLVTDLSQERSPHPRVISLLKQSSLSYVFILPPLPSALDQ